MNFETYDTPTTRSEFEHRFHILENTFKNGKISISKDVSMTGLMKVRRLPNGRLDFLSVNESARLQANMMLNMQRMNFPKNLDEDETLV